MASSVPEGHYRIWVNRKDTHNRISDENIWVGNIPLDGKSKITSGYTIGPDYSYVEFNSWADLLKAIGVDGPVVEYVDVYGTFEQGAGGGGDDTGTTQYFLNVSASTTTVQHDGTLNLKAVYTTIQGSDITREDVTSRNDCVWQVVSGGEYATVEHGVVTNHNQGTGNKSATVRATYQGKSDEITLTMSGTGVEPEYSLIISAATNYDTTIDSTGTTKLVAVYSDGLGGNTAVTTSATWEVTSGQNYISVSNTGSNKGTVTGLDANDSQVTCKVKATYNGYEGTANIIVRAKAGPATHDIILDDVKFLVQHVGSMEVDSVEFVSFRLYSSTTGATAAGKTFTSIAENTSASTSWDVTRFTVNNGDAVYGKLTLKVNPNSNTVLENSGFVGNGGVSWNGGTLNTDESNPQTGIYVYDHYLVGDTVTTDVSFLDVVVKIDARNNGGQPTYSLAVNVANGYSSTIDSTGTTKLVATYYDGLGGSTAVTSDAEWLVTSGAAYVNIIAGTDPLTVEGRSNASSTDQKSKVMARFNGLTADIVITILKDPVVPPYIDLEDPDDLNYFVGIPCTGLPSPGYTVVIDSNIAWKARLSDIDDAYWLHMSYDNEGVTVYIEQNTDPYSGEGGSSRASSFIIEAVDSSHGIPSITINVSQGACDDLINIPNRDPFVFTCNGASSFTRNVEAWDDVQWHIVPVFGEWEETEWFRVSPTSGVGDGSFTVTILEDNFDNTVRGSGYLQIYTGSTQTYLDWDINVRQEPTPFFVVTATTAQAPAAGGDVNVTAYTNESITATPSVNWISASVGTNQRVVGGTAYTIVTLTFQENQSVDPRTGNVLIESTYDGACRTQGSKTIEVTQNGASTDSATYIRVKKSYEAESSYRQEIEYGINEAEASTTAVTFNVKADGKCRLVDITGSSTDGTQSNPSMTVWQIEGGSELLIGTLENGGVTGGTFDVSDSTTLRAVYGRAYIGHEKEFTIVLEVNDPGGSTTSSERATVEITQERDYPVGVTGVTFENLGPYIAPNTTEGLGSCCAWHLTEMWIEIYAKTIYKSGWRTHSSEAIDNYIKRQGNLTGVDTDMLTLEVLNNPSVGQKYCLTWEDDTALADELHGGNYVPTYNYPFQIQFSPNTGTTTTTDPWADGFRRDVQFRVTYQDDDGNFAQEDFTVRVPYCNPEAPGTQDAYIISGGSHYDEVSIDVGVNEDVEIQVGGLVIGETRLSFDCDESITTSILDNFEIQHESFDPSTPINEWVARDTTQPIISFTRKSPYAFTFYIDCLRNGYEPVRLIVEFDDV